MPRFEDNMNLLRTASEQNLIYKIEEWEWRLKIGGCVDDG